MKISLYFPKPIIASSPKEHEPYLYPYNSLPPKTTIPNSPLNHLQIYPPVYQIISKMSEERRAAIDVGSGMTKLQVADVAGGAIQRFLYSIEVSVPFGVVFSQSRTLTPQVMDTGMDALRHFKQKCSELKVDEGNIRAIGTEVFRKAPNGKAFLDSVKQSTGISVRLIEQEEEAELGYMSGKAMLAMSDASGKNANEKDLVVYDSGGGSFQIMMKQQGALRMYLKPMGTAPCHAMLMELKGIQSSYLNATPNPCSEEEIRKFLGMIQGKLKASDEADKVSPKWLEGKDLVCIGGINSIGRMAYDFLGQSKSFMLQDIERILFEMAAGKSDKQLEPLYRVKKEMEPPAYVVAKMALLYSTMLHTKAKTVHFEEIIGSCPGLLIRSS